MEIKIREFEKKNEHEIQNTMKSISGIDSEQWKWKFFGNPEIKSKIWIIEDGSTLAGYMALQGVNLNIDTQIVPGCQVEDIFIKENYRRKGLFVKLGKTSLDNAGQNDMLVTIGFPNLEALGGHLKYGWKNIGMVPRALKPLDINQYSESLKKRPPFVKLFLKLKCKERIMPEHNLKIEKISIFSENIDRFTKHALDGRNAVSRTSKYLNWRYCKAPHREYVKFLASQNDEIKGYIVGYESVKNPGCGYVVDLLVKPGDKQTARILIKTMEEYFKTKKVFAVYSWIPNHHEFLDAFKKSGYIFRKPTQPFIVRVNNESKEFDKIYSFEDWFITMGDSDLH